MKNCGSMEYYRQSERHIAAKFQANLDELEAKKNKWGLTNIRAEGINYTVDFQGIPFDKLRIPSNIKILAYNYCSSYTEVDHANHWDIARELGLVK